MLPDDRAFPSNYQQYWSGGLTKRELIGAKMAEAIVQGLYSFQGNIGQLTEKDIAKAAWKLADAVIKQS